MTQKFRLTLAQLNPCVGDLQGNADQARAAFVKAKAAGAQMLAMPEMFLPGYQAQDLITKPAFVADCLRHIQQLAADCKDGPAVGIGAPLARNGKLFNAYFILQGGKITAEITKFNLPNKTVFDEQRLFDVGPICGPYSIGGLRIGTPICEDAWHDDVCEALQESGAQVLMVVNGSPYYREKLSTRHNLMVEQVVKTGLPLVYLNMVGGQDDQVFDGGSFVLNPGGQLMVQMPAFDACITHVDFEETTDGWRVLPGDLAPVPDVWEQDYRVMVEALRDYVSKSGFKKVLLGLSGGIDSGLVATIAVDALGADNVRGVMLPSEYTGEESLRDARSIADLQGFALDTVPISQARTAVTETLAPMFAGHAPDLTEENIQSRLRGLLLMALSNKFGEMLLTTGNKSEVAVGYATIYGDMAGGYNPIKDLYKMRVFESSRWRNANHRDWMKGAKGQVIPPRVIDKPPTAELRADQKDSDSLPPYEILDGILECLIDKDMAVADVVAAGFDRATVKRVEALIYASEYKRFQSAPGARTSGRAFWLDRRYPMVNKWRDQS